MLARIRGGASGIKEYLEKGQKQGREHSRDELDERVILDGDLELTDTIINGIDNDGDKYLHITLAFKEDEVSRETLEAITGDFKEFAFSAFETDEYSFYAEAHLPRIKSYYNAQTGELVERKPHIHIIIPKQNLLNGESLNPLGIVERQVKYLEAFQEIANAKYGLASPKENRRGLFTNDSEFISRYKGDNFTGGQKDLKEAILSDIIDNEITNYDEFKRILSKRGEIKVRNERKEKEYLWLKTGDGKGVNLRDAAFKRHFIELPTNQKRLLLATDSKYETSGQPKEPLEKYQSALSEWHGQRAKEIKYVYLGRRREYDEYKNASPDEKARILLEREKRFYETNKPELNNDYSRADYIRDNLRAVANHVETAGRDGQAVNRTDGYFDEARRNVADRRNRGAGRTALERGDREAHHETDRGDPILKRETDSVTGQLIRDQKTKDQAKTANREFAEIKQNLDAKRLLNKLSHSHGVNPAKYEISKGQDGGDRIKAGTRNLNVSDFLTKELNLDYREAGRILREAYREQTGREQGASPRKQASADLWREYQAARQAKTAERKAGFQERKRQQLESRQSSKDEHKRKLSAIRANSKLTAAERKASISIVKMERVAAETAIREQSIIEREMFAAARSDEYRNGYKNWLAVRAQAGDEAALSELRRQRHSSGQIFDGLNVIEGSAKVKRDEDEQTAQLLARRLVYSIDHAGNVTYYADAAKRRALVIDSGQRVTVASAKDSQAVEIGLQLAVQKFGTALKIEGNEEFKRQVIEAAVKTGLRVEFDSPAMNDELKRRRAERDELQARGKAFIDSEREKAAAVPPTPEPARTSQPEAPEQPRKPRDIER